MTDFEILSCLVDRNGLGPLLSMLSQVCSEKANRMRSDYNNESILVRSWERDARSIDRIIVLN